MSEKDEGSAREQLLRRIEQMRVGPIASGPMSWHDIAFLVHGMAFAAMPLQFATGGIVDRHDLGPRGPWILNLIAIGLNEPLELAAMLDIVPSLVSAELARLTKAGLIVSRQGQRDRRRSELALTPHGEDTLEELRAELTQLVAESLPRYRPEELRLCGRILADMQGAVRKWTAETKSARAD